METSTRSGRITVDLLSFKEPWLSYCRTHSTTASEAFRMVVAKLVADVDAPRAPASDVVVEDDDKVRVEIRLTRAERIEAATLAHTEGFALPRWITALVRARIGRGAQLGQSELELLARSNMQMLALGRTLQQLASAANANPILLQSFSARQVEQTAALVKAHAKIVAQVIAQNTSRWRIK